MLKTQRKRYFRNLLYQMLNELAAKNSASRRNGEMKTMRFPDPIDWATAHQETDISLRLIERDLTLMENILEAIEKINDGTFGICESCAEAIGMERLEAFPAATLCVECKRKAESEKRRPVREGCSTSP